MATIQIRKSLVGVISYRVLIRLKGQAARTATFPTKAQAQAWAREQEAPRRARPAAAYTLHMAIERYRREVLPLKRLSTQPTQHGQLRWWAEHLGQQTLAQITTAILSRYRTQLLETVSSATANRYLAMLSHVYTVAIKEWEWCQDNPVSRLKRFREAPGRVRFLSETERARLLAACQASRAPYLYMVVVLALSTGARRGEILRLQWADVDMARRRVTFRDSKNRETRTVPLTGPVVPLLVAWPVHTPAVFPAPAGARVYDIRSAFQVALKRADIRDFHFHDLRHTTASYLALAGASLLDIAEILGHKSLDITRRYAHLTEGHTRARLDQVTERFEIKDL